MFDPALLLAFLAAATILTVTPGLDTALVLRSSAVGGWRTGVAAGGGILVGCLVWGAAVSLGLGALLQASALAYTLVTWAGAAYLVWLGARMLLHPRDMLATGTAGTPVPTRTALRDGLLSNLLNPKIGVFYVTFLPQFIPPHANVALHSFLLALIHIALTVIWFALLIVGTVPLGRVLRRPSVVRRLDRITGGIFIAFGIRLAVTSR